MEASILLLGSVFSFGSGPHPGYSSCTERKAVAATLEAPISIVCLVFAGWVGSF